MCASCMPHSLTRACMSTGTLPAGSAVASAAAHDDRRRQEAAVHPAGGGVGHGTVTLL